MKLLLLVAVLGSGCIQGIKHTPAPPEPEAAEVAGEAIAAMLVYIFTGGMGEKREEGFHYVPGESKP